MKLIDRNKVRSFILIRCYVIMQYVTDHVRIGNVGVCSSLLKQEVAGLNPVVINPERGALRSQLR